MKTYSFGLIALVVLLFTAACQNPNFSSGAYLKSISVSAAAGTSPYQRWDFSYRGERLEEVRLLQTSDELVLQTMQYQYAGNLIRKISYYRADTLTHEHTFLYDGVNQLVQTQTIFSDPTASQQSYVSEYLFLDDSTWLVKRLQDDVLIKVDS
ncbi:MAG: hypothetical protein AAF399_29130, partial [Bacteroidota bacterium]